MRGRPPILAALIASAVMDDTSTVPPVAIEDVLKLFKRILEVLVFLAQATTPLEQKMNDQ